MAEIININGEIHDAKNAKISVFDRGFLYGDSVYEVTKTIKGIPLFWEEHLERLWLSGNRLGMDFPFSKQNLTYEVKKTLKVLNENSVYIRIIITRGIGEISLDPSTSANYNYVIITKDLPPNPSWWVEEGVHVIIADTRKFHSKAMDPTVKSGNYLNNVMAFREAKKRGAFDAIMLNEKGNVAEGTTNNVWMMKDNTFITPPLEAGILKGITREKLIELLEENKINFKEKAISPNEFKNADEAFLTSSNREIVPISKIDDHILKIDKIRDIIKLYKECIERYIKKNNSFLV